MRVLVHSLIHESVGGKRCSALPYQLRLVGDVATSVAVGVHEQLRVGVDGDEGLEVAVALDQVHHVLHLDLRVSRWAVVGVGARVPAGTRTCGGRKSYLYNVEINCSVLFVVLFPSVKLSSD